MTSRARNAGRLPLAVFGFTLFLSASLMFAVQPMVGKMLLPIVGGTPAGWIVAMAFFQVMLLAGYLVAHLFSTVTPRRHGLMYLLGLLLGVSCLPISFATHSFETTPNAIQVFVLLTECVAVPFIALSATSSTIQRLFTLTKHSASDDPYFLYVASNLGSFTGLFLYPVVIEPALTLDRQAACLNGGYALLIAMGALCLALAAKKETKKSTRAGAKLPARSLQLKWLALSFVPSSLLMSATTYITTDVISAPMIWIIPLSIYLLTFVAAFSRKPLMPQSLLNLLHPYVICATVFSVSLLVLPWLNSWAGVAFYAAAFGFVALACHTRLAGLRPSGEGRQLTSFYLMMSLGGALGGVLNAFIIPNVFDRLVEFPLMMLASFMVHPAFRAMSREGKRFMALIAVSVLLVNAPPLPLGMESAVSHFAFFCAIFIALSLTGPWYYKKMLQPVPMTMAALLVFMVSQYIIADQSEILSVRNFFGTIKVLTYHKDFDGKTLPLRLMQVGSTIHGMQVLDNGGPLERIPTAYYTKQGPLGDVFTAYHPRNVAVLGLGAGATNCYTAPDRTFTFFDIDPDVVKIAREKFTFLDKCVSKSPPKIIIGDGRLEYAKLRNEMYDLLVIDVFSSDSIPTHIITQEALKLYFTHIAQGGALTINISNRYFSLWNMIAATAGALGLETTMKSDLAVERPDYSASSIWLVIAHPEDLSPALGKHGWKKVAPPEGTRPWTDNYTNLLSTLFTGNSPDNPP